MNKIFTCMLFAATLLLNNVNGQNIAINTDGALPDASAMIDIASTTKGFLAPRMTTVQQLAIASPAKGLLIYNTTDNVFKVNTGTAASPVWTTLSASSNNWLLTGNSGTSAVNNFLGTTDNTSLAFRTNNSQHMLIDAAGRVGIGVTNPANPLVVKDTLEIRRTATVSQLLFSNTAGTGDFRIGGDGSDIFWQGGGGRNLQMGSYWGIQLMGDRQSGTFPSFANGVANTGVLVQAQRDASVPLAIQSGSASQSANLTEWRDAAGTVLNVVDKNGNMAIGSSTFNASNPEKLIVNAGSTSSVNAIVGKGSINSYLQLNIQNQSAGSNASSDVVATANNGDETSNYVDMGINGGGYSGGLMGGANDGYLYTMGNNFLIATANAAKSLVFMTGGTSQAVNERMRIDGNGNVGIGTTNPTYKLQVNAASNPLYLAGVQTGVVTDSLLTISNGVVRRVAAASLSASTGWGLTGNAGTNPSYNFLGTTDAQAFVIKQNNTQAARFETNSIALGNGATTNTATHSYAFGSGAIVGSGKTAGLALGKNAEVNADNSTAIGVAAEANGAGSVAIGNGAAANNTNSLAIGNSAVTAYSITDAVAVGSSSTANSNNAIAIGKGALTGFNLTNPLSIGVSATSNGSNSVAIGSNAAISFATNTTVIGSESSASSSAANSTAIGYNTDITKPNAIILGDMTNTALSVGIGSENFSNTFREKLLVDAGATTSVNAIVGRGSINSYLQLNIQNNSAGTSASSDVVATANNGNETTNYVDMGINGGSYSGGVMGSANDSYLYNMGQNFLIGTGTSGKSLVFMTGGTSQAANERMRIDGTGNVAIGATTFNATNPEQLLVDAGATTSVNAIVGRGSINSYLQLNIQNNSAGTSASSDVVATANNGSETTNYVDMGINGGNYSGGVMGAANDGYLYTMGNNFLIATGNASKSLIFMTGGTSQATNERMRIDGTGNVGIKTTSPTSTLQVAGSMSTAITTKTASYTATANDYTILCNNTAGNISIYLPAASGVAGRIYVIKKISGVFNVTIEPSGSETIDGSLTKVISSQYNSVMVQSDGSNWVVLGSF